MLRPAHVLLVMAIVSAPEIAWAQTTVPVRSGEHRDFTRLVIQIPEDNTWRFSKQGTRATLQVSGPDLTFDTSQTFSRIPRTRLRGISARANELVLSLGCDCDIRAYEDLPQFLLIDIRGTADDRRQQATAARPVPRPVHVTQRAGIAARKAGIAVARALNGSGSEAPRTRSMLVDSVFPAPVGPARIAADAPIERSPEVEKIREVLARTMANSVAQGLSTVPQDVSSSPQLPDADRAGTITQTVASQRPGIISNPLEHLGIEGDQASGRQNDLCAQLPDLNVPAWGTQGALDQGLPDAIRNLYDDVGQLVPAKVERLLRHYLFLGFGAEARSVLALFPSENATTIYMQGLSHIMDLDAVPARYVFPIEIAECGPMESLWAFMSGAETEPLSSIPVSALVQAVNELPEHLRLHLGPRVAQKLTTAEMFDDAAKVIEAMERVAETDREELDFTRAALEISQGRAIDAVQVEQRLIQEQPGMALLFLLRRRAAQDAPLEDALIEETEATLFQHRGTEQAHELGIHLAMAHARNKAFPIAFDVATGRQAALPDEQRTQVLNDLFARLADDADDAEFVRSVFQQQPWNLPGLRADVASLLSDRLRDLRFDAQAQLVDAAVADLRDHDGSAPLVSSEAHDQAPQIAGPQLPERDITQEARAAQAALQSAELDGGATAQAGTASTGMLQAAERAEASAARDLPASAAPSSAVPPGQPNAADLTENLLGTSRLAIDQSAALRERLRQTLNLED